MTVETTQPASTPRPGWNMPQPAVLPDPTCMPAAMGLAVTFLFWSMVTSPIVAGIGLMLFVAATAGWIRDIRHERRKL